MWMDSTFARWEVEGEAQERIKGMQREADQRRLARLAQSAEARYTHGSLLSSAIAGLQRLASRAQASLQSARSWVELPS
jgi:hypothetical protein